MSQTTHAGFPASIRISASPSTVWDVLMNPNDHWAQAFSEGTVAETDWREGSPIVWCDSTGHIGASGVVQEIVPGQRLLLRYYDAAERHPAGPLGDYTESFSLSDRGVETELRVDIAGMAQIDDQAHRSMWKQALQLIKRQAESRA